jgi:hypothetical protein
MILNDLSGKAVVQILEGEPMENPKRVWRAGAVRAAPGERPAVGNPALGHPDERRLSAPDWSTVAFCGT